MGLVYWFSTHNYLIKLPDAAWLRTLSLYASSFFAGVGVGVGWSLSSSKYSSDRRDREKMHHAVYELQMSVFLIRVMVS